MFIFANFVQKKLALSDQFQNVGVALSEFFISVVFIAGIRGKLF